ncbi:hypothetical protein PMAYCL1PPCAC_20767, partial [Pristionchus mayeri]
FAGILASKFAAREIFSFLPTRFLFPTSPNAQRVSTIRNGNFLPAIGESRRKKRISSNGEVDDSKKVVKKYMLKKNDTEMECPECDFCTHSVSSFVDHLRKKHSTTPPLAGISFLCECGHESSSENHGRKCDIANFTVIQRRVGPIRRIEKKVKTPQKCILCDVTPTTIAGYITHLQLHHKTTLVLSGIYLKCACGFEFHSQKTVGQHYKECDRREFT